jgi:hypothetical protein
MASEIGGDFWEERVYNHIQTCLISADRWEAAWLLRGRGRGFADRVWWLGGRCFFSSDKNCGVASSFHAIDKGSTSDKDSYHTTPTKAW